VAPATEAGAGLQARSCGIAKMMHGKCTLTHEMHAIPGKNAGLT
jgi:hypothetical protein